MITFIHILFFNCYKANRGVIFLEYNDEISF